MNYLRLKSRASWRFALSMRALLHRRVHATPTPIPAIRRDSEIPLCLSSGCSSRLLYPGSSLLFSRLPSTCFGLACQRWDTHLVTGRLRALPTWRGFHPTRRLHRERREDAEILTAEHFESQHPFGVSGCIPALKSGVLARRFSIKWRRSWMLE